MTFYTEVLGFVKKVEIPMGEHRWLTVVSPEEPDGTQLVLEPDAHPAAGPFKRALVEDGIPFTSFAVADVRRSTNGSARRGSVSRRSRPRWDRSTTAVLDDTCGNLIQIVSEK